MYSLTCSEENCNAQFHSHEPDKQKAIEDLGSQLKQHNSQSGAINHKQKSDEEIRQEVESNIKETNN